MLIKNDICNPMFTAVLFTIVKIWKQPKCPSTDKWIKKMWYIENDGILLSHKERKEILQVIALSGIGKETKDKHRMISLTRGI